MQWKKKDSVIKKTDISKKIILFGQRRNGTTMTFNLFRQIPDMRCYHEPFHPKLLRGAHWKGPSEIERDAKSVHSDYKTIISKLPEYYFPLGAPVFPVEQELEAEYWSRNHTRYLEYLFSTTTNVLLKAVRVNYHLKRIYSDFPDVKFIWILRSPEGVVSSLMKRQPGMFDINTTRFHLFAHRYFLKIMNKFHKVAFKKENTTSNYYKFWSQAEAADYLVTKIPKYKKFKNYHLWFKLMLVWYDSVESVESFRQLIPPDQFAVIRYEDICYDPNDIMTRLCDWLKIDSFLTDFRELVYAEPSSIYREEDNRWQWAESILNELHKECAGQWRFPVKTRIGIR